MNSTKQAGCKEEEESMQEQPTFRKENKPSKSIIKTKKLLYGILRKNRNGALSFETKKNVVSSETSCSEIEKQQSKVTQRKAGSELKRNGKLEKRS